MPRTIIQIAVVPEKKKTNSAIIALCDDGTLWEHIRVTGNGRNDDWFPLPPIPQDQPAVEIPGMKLTHTPAKQVPE